MADENRDAAAIVNPVSPEEVRASFLGPALSSNKMYLTILPAGARLAFMEQMGELVPPIFRTAVLLSFQDAIALKDMLARQLAEIEAKFKEAEAFEAKKDLGNG